MGMKNKTEKEMRKALRVWIVDLYETQENFADHVGVSRATVSKWVNQEIPDHVAFMMGYEPIVTEKKYRRIK